MRPYSKALPFQTTRPEDLIDRTLWRCTCGALVLDPQHCPTCDKEQA